MGMVEGRGWVAPSPISVTVGQAEQRLMYSIAAERTGRRAYAGRSDTWGRGLSAGRVVQRIGFVPKSELPGLVGTVGELALSHYLSQAIGRRFVKWDPRPSSGGDNGRDIEVLGERIQAKTRRIPYGKTLIRRVRSSGGRIEPLDFDIVVGCEWNPDRDYVDLLGWCWRDTLFDARFAKSRFDHYNLEVPDDSLFPMSQLVDHLVVKLAD